MATELNVPGQYPYLPFSKFGSEIVRQGIKLNGYTEGTPTHPEWRGYISGWTQLDGSQKVPEFDPIISYTQKDSPRLGGYAGVFYYQHPDTEGDNKLSFATYVRECSNGHKFWLNQSVTVVYEIQFNFGTIEETISFTLDENSFKTTPLYPVGTAPFYYGYEPQTYEPLKKIFGGVYISPPFDTKTYADQILGVMMKSVSVEPNGFFQPPGG